MPRKKNDGIPTSGAEETVKSLRYPAKRKNIPPAGLAAHGVVKDVPAMQRAFNPHLAPNLKSPPDAHAVDRLYDRVQWIIEESRGRSLEADEVDVLSEALRQYEPWLEWSGKRERPWFVVNPVALHMHERVSTEAILRALERKDVQRDLFADPQQEYSKAVQFYQHDVDWANRMILGDSLQVMASLAGREDQAGKIQMIYIDPPYGIKFKSNFQPQIGKRNVGEAETDITREPEMVKAYRDTWTLGVHSYLAYIRDRLSLARDLLTRSGSVFVQISDENVHRVRCVMDELFGANNFCALIPFRTTSNQTDELLSTTFDFLLWYAKDKSALKCRKLYKPKQLLGHGGSKYTRIEMESGERGSRLNLMHEESPESARPFRCDTLVSQSGSDSTEYPVDFQGIRRKPRSGYWKTGSDGMKRLIECDRIIEEGQSIGYVRYFDDFSYMQLSAMWDDTSGVQSRSDPKRYVVQTSTQVVERCILLTTDPGDLVLDPTCGSGTTAYVAEKWGRRWIMVDTSRVALTLAKHRLLTARFDYFKLRSLNAEDRIRNPDGAWIRSAGGDSVTSEYPLTIDCQVVPHITLRSIARNTSLDPICSKHGTLLDQALEELNTAAAQLDPSTRAEQTNKLIAKHRESGARAITDADIRRWLLPNTESDWIHPVPGQKPLKAITARQVKRYRERIPQGEWRHWEVPFDIDVDWPVKLRNALLSYRAVWHSKMCDVNRCIAANAEMEELVDEPLVDSSVIRVTGPFTVEGVIAIEEGPDSPIGGVPLELDTGASGGSNSITLANAEAHLDAIIRLLLVSGVDFPGNKRMMFQRLDPVSEAGLIHAEGEWPDGDAGSRRVAVSIGPEVGNVSSKQIEESVRAATRKAYDDVVYAGFGFDAQAQDAIDTAQHPHLQLHMALIRPDVAMADLLKSQPGCQLFTVFSSPRLKGPLKQPDGTVVVEVEGMDVYDPVKNALFPTSRDRIAAWFVDTDYDGRTFCICQAFFPDRTRWDQLAKALHKAGTLDASLFDALSGYRSLPFSPPSKRVVGDTWKIAVKVIDPRGNEGLRVVDGGVLP